MRRPASGPEAGPDGVGTVDPDFQALLPTLWEYLTDQLWEDGSPRVTATITLFVEDGMVKLCLNDRALERTGWVSGRAVMEAVAVLEDALRLDRLEWRGKPKGPARRR